MMTAKRRIIQALAVLPLLFCVFLWVWSYIHTERITYYGSQRKWSAQIAVGGVDFWSGAAVDADSGWDYAHMHPDWEIDELYTGLPHWHFIGVHFFCGAHPYSPGVTAVLLVIPFWILTLGTGLALGLLCWAMRGCPNAPP